MTRHGDARNPADDAFAFAELKAFRLETGSTYAIVLHNPETRVISNRWFGDPGGDEGFRRVVDCIAANFETGAYSYWLADQRYLSRSYAGSVDWLAESAMPRIIRAGLIREAVVVPPDRGQPEGYDVFETASKALALIADGRVRGFTDLERAKRWLLHGQLPGDD